MKQMVRVRVDAEGQIFNFKGYLEREGFFLMGLKEMSKAMDWCLKNMFNWFDKRGKSPKTNQWKLEHETWKIIADTAKLKPYYISRQSLEDFKLVSANDAQTFAICYDNSAKSRVALAEEYFLYLAYLGSNGWLTFEEMVNTESKGKNLWYVQREGKIQIVGGQSIVSLEEIPNPDFPMQIHPLITIPTDE